MATLPKTIKPIRDVIDGTVKKGEIINVIGIVTDFRAPISTSREGKKTLTKMQDQKLVANAFRLEMRDAHL